MRSLMLLATALFAVPLPAAEPVYDLVIVMTLVEFVSPKWDVAVFLNGIMTCGGLWYTLYYIGG